MLQLQPSEHALSNSISAHQSDQYEDDFQQDIHSSPPQINKHPNLQPRPSSTAGLDAHSKAEKMDRLRTRKNIVTAQSSQQIEGDHHHHQNIESQRNDVFFN